jgi:teichuronic acid biosynthesis glycosyltransferase TuaH
LHDTPVAPRSRRPGRRLDILLIARHPFGGHPPLGDWQMARALHHRGHHVLYVEPPVVVGPGRRALLGSLKRPAFREVEARLHVLTPTVVPGATRPITAGMSDRLVARQVAAATGELFANVPVLLTFDPLRGVLPGVARRLTVYWRRDRLADLEISPTAAWLAQRDRELLGAADLVSCTARPLLDESRRWSDGVVIYIPNGCEVQHFARPRHRPSDMPDGRVVLGFVGGAFWRLDLGLLADLTAQRPEWQLVMIGDDRLSLPDRANIHRVPYLPYDDVPAWMQHLDVGLIPYDTDIAFNHGSFPIKAFEYLASGVPVVSTMLPAIEGLEPWVRRADDRDAFIDAIDVALEEGPSAASCVELASRNTWSARAEELEFAIDDGLEAATNSSLGMA